jgi:hypothetical protein
MTSPGLGPIPQRRRSTDSGGTPGTGSTPSVSLPPPLGPMQTLRLEISSLQRKSGLDAALNPDDYIRHLAPDHLVDLSKELYSIVKRVLKMKKGERQRTLDPVEAHIVRAHHNGSRDGLTESATVTRGGTAISTVDSEDTDTDEDRSGLNIEVTTPTLREVDASCLIPLLELEKNSDTDDDDDNADGRGREKRSKSMKSVTMTHPDETDVDQGEHGHKTGGDTFTVLGPFELLQTPALGEPLLGTIRPGRPKGSFDGVPATVVVRSIPASCLKRRTTAEQMQDSSSLLGDTGTFNGQSPAVSTSAISLALSVPGASLENLVHLQRHAATVKRLKHKNLVPVQEIMEDKDNLYLVSNLCIASSTSSITPHTSGIFQMSGSVRNLLHHGNINTNTNNNTGGGLTREDTGVIGSPNSFSFPKGSGQVADHIFELDETGEVVRPLPDVMKVRGYIRQIANALRYLELHRVVHLDLKPNNVFVSGDDIQIADYALNGFLDVLAWRPGSVRNQKVVSEVFGGSEVSSPRDREEGSPLRRHLKAPTQVELPAFMAPELCLWDPETSPPLTSSADVWSLGVLLYCMLLGRLPFRGSNAGAMMMSILQDEPEFPEDDSIDPAWVDLLRGMLEKNPDDRITLGALLRHPFLKTRSDSMGRGGFFSSRDDFLSSGGPALGRTASSGDEGNLSQAELETAILSLSAIPAQRTKSPRKPPLAPGGTPRSTSRRASSSFGSSFNSSTNSVTGGLVPLH